MHDEVIGQIRPTVPLDATLVAAVRVITIEATRKRVDLSDKTIVRKTNFGLGYDVRDEAQKSIGMHNDSWGSKTSLLRDISRCFERRDHECDPCRDPRVPWSGVTPRSR
jgi:hypothetical protein